MFKNLWQWLTTRHPSPPTQVSLAQVITRICKILTVLDEQQKAMVKQQEEIRAQLTAFQQHMNKIHERQVATLDKLSFMARTEERQLMHVEQRMDEHGWGHEGEEHNP